MNVYKSNVVATGFVVGGWVALRLMEVVVSVVCCKKKKCIRSKIKMVDKRGRSIVRS
jgi:hypothetical protein